MQGLIWQCVCKFKNMAWAAYRKHASSLMESVPLERQAFEFIASVMYIKVRETLSLWVSIIFFSAFHWSLLLPLQTQLWLKMQFLIFHSVSLLLTRFSTTMTFSFFSVQILLFLISFLPPYFGYYFLVIMDLRWVGGKSKDIVWKLQHLHHFSMSSENQFRKDNEFWAIELIPCNISTLRVGLLHLLNHVLNWTEPCIYSLTLCSSIVVWFLGWVRKS